MPHQVGVQVRPGVYTTNDPKYHWDSNLCRLVNAFTGQMLGDDVRAFMLVSSDIAAHAALQAYISECEDIRAPDSHILVTSGILNKFYDFAKFNASKMRVPTTPCLPALILNRIVLGLMKGEDTKFAVRIPEIDVYDERSLSAHIQMVDAESGELHYRNHELLIDHTTVEQDEDNPLPEFIKDFRVYIHLEAVFRMDSTGRDATLKLARVETVRSNQDSPESDEKKRIDDMKKFFSDFVDGMYISQFSLTVSE